MNNSIDQGFNTLIFDAGNLFFKKNSIDPGVSLDVAKENARTIVKSFNYISCDAFSPGSLAQPERHRYLEVSHTSSAWKTAQTTDRPGCEWIQTP